MSNIAAKMRLRMPTLRLGQPVWLRRQGTGRRQIYPSLDGHCDVDVAIVGGGMTGSTVATIFAAAGVRVGLVEAAFVGRGSTAASTALLLQEPDKGLTDLGRRYGATAAARIWELSQVAARDFVKTIGRLEIDCDLVERDSVYYTTKAEVVGTLRSEYLRRRKAGFTGEWLTPGALRRLTGLPGRAAIRTSGNAQFDPYKACVGLLRSASRIGARVFERSAVRRIDRARHGVRIVTAGGTIAAAQVVIATGYATPYFQPLVGRFRMNHTYVLATKPIGVRQRRELGLGEVMLWDTERPYHYARWTPDQRLLLGGADRPLVSARRRAKAFRTGTQELREHFEALLPGLADVGIDYAWEGLFAMTPDGLPYVGPHRRYPRHLFALGYGGNGMTFGFLAARMLLEQWQGVESSDHRLFAFGRNR
jgi:glycine/D-amino acid oxidase-like deaminating enzyme